MTAKFEIDISATGKGSLVVDGKDLSNLAKGFVLDSSAHNVTELTVDLAALGGAHAIGEAEVFLSLETCDFLKSLGWTPPDAPPTPTPGGAAPVPTD